MATASLNIHGRSDILGVTFHSEHFISSAGIRAGKVRTWLWPQNRWHNLRRLFELPVVIPCTLALVFLPDSLGAATVLVIFSLSVFMTGRNHGAEHKVAIAIASAAIEAQESQKELTYTYAMEILSSETIQRYPKFSVQGTRCGSETLSGNVVLLLLLGLLTLKTFSYPLWPNVVILGIVSVVIAPWISRYTQYITTREPTDKEIEVAVAAFKGLLEAEKRRAENA